MATHFETDQEEEIRMRSFSQSNALGEALARGTNEASRVTIEKIIEGLFEQVGSEDSPITYAVAQGFKYGYETRTGPIVVNHNQAGAQ